MSNLNSIFNPKNIVIIGASDRKGSVGRALMKNISSSGYKGKLYPVNMKRKKISGLVVHKSVKDIKDKLDLAIIATPAFTVPELVEECGIAGVKGVVIISSGFSEIGKEGEVMSADILATARKHGIRIVGPNCLGFINPALGLNATFSSEMALGGRIAFISQSGALCTAMLDWSQEHKIGFSYFISIGSMLDIGFSDLIEYLGNDKGTDSILIYMESLLHAKKFLEVTRRVSVKKPIIILKVGKSTAGAKAARSHTGSLAGDDAIFDAAFGRVGAVRIKRSADLLNVAKILFKQPMPSGNRLTVVTNAGGPGVIATDCIVESGLRSAKLQENTVKKLNKILPSAWSKGNPVDILGDADPTRYRKAIEICLTDKQTDGILVLLTPQDMTKPTEVAEYLCGLKHSRKTLMAAWMGGDVVAKGRRALSHCGIPVYENPEDAIQAFSYLAKYNENKGFLKTTEISFKNDLSNAKNKTKKLLDEITASGRQVLTEAQSKKILSYYGIPVLSADTAKSAEQASLMASKLKYPVAMKILSPDILHKTDVGGIALNINDAEEAKRSYARIMADVKKNAPSAELDGVYIEAMVEKSFEVLLGMKYDSIFGPVIVFGSGGVNVELYRDTSIGFPPLDRRSAQEMLEKTKVYQLLKGYRGQAGVDMEILIDVMVNFSHLVTDFPEFKEIDINPFALDSSGGFALDAKVILGKNRGK